MKIHAGVEEYRFSDRPGYNITICGLKVAPEQAPHSQPVSDITCGRCQKIIMSAWGKAIEARR